ncbi:hypothetical protein D9M71_847550 [compost metagenome]
MMWIGPRPSKALITGACTEWSPPSTTGITPASRILRTAYSVFLLLVAMSVWTMSASPTSTMRTSDAVRYITSSS